MKRPLCWEGQPDEKRPGCGGCCHSLLKTTRTNGTDSACETRHREFYHPDGSPREKYNPVPKCL